MSEQKGSEAEQTCADLNGTPAAARLRSEQEPVHGQHGCRASGSSIRAGGLKKGSPEHRPTLLRDIVTAFIMQHGVDAPWLLLSSSERCRRMAQASAEGALRALPMEAQRQVVGEGPLRGLNASALLMSRIRRRGRHA